jgi:hypothetical protein
MNTITPEYTENLTDPFIASTHVAARKREDFAVGSRGFAVEFRLGMGLRISGDPPCSGSCDRPWV